MSRTRASESADAALSPGAPSFVIAGKTWRLGDAIHIHSNGVGAVEKKKMVQTCGDAGSKESSWAESLAINIV